MEVRHYARSLIPLSHEPDHTHSVLRLLKRRAGIVRRPLPVLLRPVLVGAGIREATCDYLAMPSASNMLKLHLHPGAYGSEEADHRQSTASKRPRHSVLVELGRVRFM
jgi:hypothetical protein